MSGKARGHPVEDQETGGRLLARYDNDPIHDPFFVVIGDRSTPHPRTP
ncbi:hypothetical protein ACGFYY_15730 [Streptomyces sp. NPDC048331]